MTPAKHRVVIVDDQTLMREGLRALLASQANLEVVGEGADGHAAILLAKQLKPNLMLLALSMPRANGLEALKEVRRVSPKTRVLILTVQKEEDYVFAALQAGADGYELKDSSSSMLFGAVHSVLAGGKYLSPAIAEAVVTRCLGGKKLLPFSSSFAGLSSREREVLKLIAEGHRTKGIGSVLCISPRTVEKHRAKVMEKLDLHTAQALTAYAIKKGMIAN